jgi:putative aldouronate transport system substrate-binding protein
MKKKVFAVFAAISLTACSVGASAGNQPRAVAATSAPVTVDMFTSPGTDIVNMDTNWFTTYVEKKFNMKINWVLAPNDPGTKQALLLASGDYPSIFWSGSFTPSQILKYSKQGVLVPLNKYIQQYAPNVAKAMKDTPGMARVMTAPDGNIYGIPQINYCWHCYWASKYWINTRWLKELNLKMPTTPAEFENVLLAFKNHPPAGVKNVIPLDGGSPNGGAWHGNLITFLMNAFVYDDEIDYFTVQNGKVGFAPTQAGWKQGLEYINKLYKEGLFTSEALTQNADQYYGQVQQGRVGVLAEGGVNDAINYGTKGSDWQYWRSIAPLQGPNGPAQAAFFGNGQSTISFAVTNKATPEQIATVMKLVNYVFTIEGTTMLDFGPEGKFWRYAKPGEKGLTGKQALINVDWNTFYSGSARQNWGWNLQGPYYSSKDWRDGGVAVPLSSPGGSQTLLQVETTKNYAGHQPKQVYPAAVWIAPSDVQQYSMLQTNINSYVSQWTDEFIVGTKNIDTDWAAYVQGLNGLGLSQYLQMSQTAMGSPFDTSSFKGQG